MDNYKEVNGTSYHEDTDPEVIKHIEWARKTGHRIICHYGDINTPGEVL